MPKSKKRATSKKPAEPQPENTDSSQAGRAPYQKNSDRDAVKSAEETRDIPTTHGAIK
jgi:hypothetical protein